MKSWKWRRPQRNWYWTGCILVFHIVLIYMRISCFVGCYRICCVDPDTVLNSAMDWITPWPCDLSYGYRGRDCRANLYFLPSGEAVYFIACVVVLYHINNRTQRHYRKHTDCVRWSVWIKRCWRAINMALGNMLTLSGKEIGSRLKVRLA